MRRAAARKFVEEDVAPAHEPIQGRLPTFEEKVERGILSPAQVDELRRKGDLARDKHIQACVRVPVAKCPARVPQRWIDHLEQNQKIASCCRHPETHELAAFYSSAEDRNKGVPDVYVFYCPCGREHSFFCVGGSQNPITKEHTHRRPFWEIR